MRVAEWNRIRNNVRIESREITKILIDIKQELEDPPKITAIRVGARNKPWEGNLYPLHKAGLLKLHTIEPDEAECNRLSNLSDRDYAFYSKGLSEHDADRTLP